MTDDPEKPTQELTTQQRAAIGKTTPNGVSGRLKIALDDMIERGTPWEQAGVKANLTVRAMRLALKRPVVIQYLRDARRVWLSSATGENLNALARLRDQNSNMAAAVTAAKTLEGLATEQFEPGSIAIGQPAAGYVIDLSDERSGLSVRIVSPMPRRHGDDAIDVTPNKDGAE
jgi:hypothetical protein